MNKIILITFTILFGLIFCSCKNNNSESKQSKAEQGEIPITDLVKQSENDELADKVKKYISTQFLTEADLRAITEDQRKFQLQAIDLNNDGNKEVLVNFMTPYFCGTGGCTVLLLSHNLELITRFSPAQAFYLEDTLENDWRVLFTKTEGSWRKLVYENGTYPSNPTMVEATDYIPEQSEKIFDEDNGKQKTYTF